eukprot:1160589-Pelagomonas_calceolata.AAC.2
MHSTLTANAQAHSACATTVQQQHSHRNEMNAQLLGACAPSSARHSPYGAKWLFCIEWCTTPGGGMHSAHRQCKSAQVHHARDTIALVHKCKQLYTYAQMQTRMRKCRHGCMSALCCTETHRYTQMHRACTPMHNACTPMHNACTRMHHACTQMHNTCTVPAHRCIMLAHGCTMPAHGCTTPAHRCTTDAQCLHTDTPRLHTDAQQMHRACTRMHNRCTVPAHRCRMQTDAQWMDVLRCIWMHTDAHRCTNADR